MTNEWATAQSIGLQPPAASATMDGTLGPKRGLHMISRRAMLLTPVAAMAAGAVSAASGKMVLAIHQNTSAGAGYRKSLEGWARAGIKNVEITNTMLDEFLKTDTLPAARRVLTDLGLTPVQGGTGVGGLWEPNPNHAVALDNLKKRCEMFAALGLNRIYSAAGKSNGSRG